MPVSPDPVWEAIRAEARADAEQEPLLASYMHATILNHARLENALCFQLANLLASATLPAILLMELMLQACDADPSIGEAVRVDLQAVRQRDPACVKYCIPLLYFKGFQALQGYRIAHWLWGKDRQSIARMLQSRMSEAFAVDIHPAARIGKGILLDHATGVVIGETAVVGDNVSILHEVTLGGTGKQGGDRHPKVGNGVLIGAGAKILGNIRIGDGAKVGAGSVVLNDVPAHSTVVGVPAVVVGRALAEQPALLMDHWVANPPTSPLDGLKDVTTT